MAKTLVLAEKPSVGRDLAAVLECKKKSSGFIEGEKYIVSWSLGHLVTLADPEYYDKKYEKWNILDLPMLPKKMNLVIIKETAKQFKVVQSLMKRKDVSDLIIATDSGREGELVARWIILKAGWNKPTKRLWISSQTTKAIKDGFENLYPASNYDNLFKSAQARSIADWLIGLNVTRALTCKHSAQLSAGRVQTPTLAMIVDRENKIKNFIPQDYWTVTVKTPEFTATWQNKNGQSRISRKQDADRIAGATQGRLGTVTEISKQYKYKAPPAAYDLTELQRDANKKYAYSAKETLAIMQSLYEKHKVLTYPRTDSRYISDDVVATLPERIRSICFGEYAPAAKGILHGGKLQTKYIVNNSKVTDHHAIIPTEEPIDLIRMTGPERNIYDLVVRRFLAVLMPPFEYEEITLKLNVSREIFTARGMTVKSIGWKGAYKNILADDEDNIEEKAQNLPLLKQSDSIKVLTSKVNNFKTIPPARFTEATLLSAMEHPTAHIEDKSFSKILEQTSGLGTPATRADIIEKLFSSFYIERNGKQLVPTSKGIQLISLVPADLRSAELTAKWEQELSLISKGKVQDKDFIEKMHTYATNLVNQVKVSAAVYKHDNVTREKCPDCGKFLLDVKGKRGKMLVCPDRECGYKKSVSVLTNARCPNCHKKMELRGEDEHKSFFCVCGYREKLSAFEKRKSATGANKSDVKKYMSSQNESWGNSSLKDQLLKWKNDE